MHGKTPVANNGTDELYRFFKNGKEREKMKRQQNEAKKERTDIIRENLNLLFESEPGSKVRVAEECGVTKPVVTRWVLSGNNRAPAPEYLYIVAKHFNVTVDWILTRHENRQNDRPTYTDAFTALFALCRNETLTPDAVSDPVLNALLTQAAAVTGRRALSAEQKDRYLAGITKRFRKYTIPEKADPAVFRAIIETVPGIADIDPVFEAENLAKIVSDKETYEKIRDEYKI